MKLFSESTSVPVKTGTPGRWSAVFLTEGQGSSGNWLRETIERDGPAALPKGSRCFVTHNRLENGEPDPFRMWGVLAEDARYDGNGNLVGEIDILPSWVDRVEEVAPHTALSVFLMGEANEDGDITKIHQDVQNGVDMVVHPGRQGSSLVEKLYESAIAGSTTPSATVVQEGNGDNVDIEKAIDALTAKVDALVADKDTARAADAQVKADEAVAKERVESFATAVKAVDEAELFDSQRATILEAAKTGADVTPLIESAKLVKEEALAAAGTARAEEDATGAILGGRKYESAADLGKVLG